MRMRSVPFAAALTAALLLAPALQAPASAAPGCYRDSCSGKDPAAMGCTADAVTLDHLYYGSIRIDMRYSRACSAAWTRSNNPIESQNTLFSQIIAYSCGSRDRETARACRVGVYGNQVQDGVRWTQMWSYRYWVRSCFNEHWSTDVNPVSCTDPH
jgi:hypothetical protein